MHLLIQTILWQQRSAQNPADTGQKLGKSKVIAHINRHKHLEKSDQSCDDALTVAMAELLML